MAKRKAPLKGKETEQLEADYRKLQEEKKRLEEENKVLRETLLIVRGKVDRVLRKQSDATVGSGSAVEMLRKARAMGWKLVELSQEIGLSISQVSRICSGQSVPNETTARQIAEFARRYKVS